MAQSLLSLFFSTVVFDSGLLCILQTTASEKELREAFAQGALLSVLHLCPVLPMGGGGLGLTDRVQHINFNCIAESLFPTQPPPYLSRSPAPTPIHPRRMGQEAGHAAASRSARHAGP